ncbi:MAG: hypothetical protein BGO49_03950 [Planctomycetales bacterium 71-10]|nr:MAG: hypothetical protein BGO49_03950 [Planctomycetales bacterium 71-10]
MPSPFPGMNPYLEQPALWPDFHAKFLVELAERLVSAVRPRYFVLLERHVFVQEPPGEPTTIRLRPDVLIATPRRHEGGGVAVADVAAPVEVEHLAQEVERVSYLEIREAASGDVVAVVELLSSAHKDEDRLTYLARREKILGSAVHLVEIDILRGGRPMPEFNRPPCAYSVLVSHADGRPRAGFWPIQLRERLPEIPVPLRRPDPPAKVDLQAILHRVYDVSAYEDFIYRGRPEPPLDPDDAAWAEALKPKPA